MDGIPFVTTGSYPCRSGNRVRPLVDGEPAFRRICEAVESASQSVWVTVTFLWDTFVMPDGRGSFFDVIDAAARRGIDVRVLFWRPDADRLARHENTFWGSPEQIAFVEQRCSGVSIRWDRARAGCAQHQKSWLVDAGRSGEIAFVGGINQNPHSMVAPGHRGAGHNHDVYVELAGPSVVDVHHNFVQRWNEASERAQPDGVWGAGGQSQLPFPVCTGPAAGSATVQIQRTIGRGQYSDSAPSVGADVFDIGAGERSVFDQYVTAIGAARSTIYVENQYLEAPEIVAALSGALERDVSVVMLLPGEPDDGARTAANLPERADFVRARAGLGDHENFTLAGLAGLDSDGKRNDVYVHAKVMLIDDAWATIGSANLHWYSMFGNGELNVSFHDPVEVRALRGALLAEHLEEDTTHLDDRAALARFREIAFANRRRRDTGESTWRGNAFALDARTYAR